MKIRIFLAEGNPMLMKGIAARLQSEKHFTLIIGEGHGPVGLDDILLHQPDILIYDIDTNGERNGFPLLREIRKKYGKRVQVIATTDNEDTGTYLAFFNQGGNGYLHQLIADEEITYAVRAIIRGGLFLSYRLQSSLLRKILAATPPLEPESFACLSPSERKVLSRLQKGYTINEIADQFSLSPDTIENNKKSVMKKLGIHNQTDLRIKILFSDLE